MYYTYVQVLTESEFLSCENHMNGMEINCSAFMITYNLSLLTVHIWATILESEAPLTLLLSYSDLRSLSGLSNLSTLVLDSNEVNSHVVFPSIPKLEVLWVNKNKITNLSVFVEAVASSFPLLTHLSMMNNSAAPSYFNGGSLQEYEDYR